MFRALILLHAMHRLFLLLRFATAAVLVVVGSAAKKAVSLLSSLAVDHNSACGSDSTKSLLQCTT